MKDLFNPDKFLIQGYKGTGKTYLYRALADPVISKRIQEWAGIPHEETQESLFVNVLPKVEGDKGYPFKSIQYNQIDEPDYYFNCFWQIYTWNSLLLLDEFKQIRESSELASEILEIRGGETAKRFNRLIDNGVDTLIVIERDLEKINDYIDVYLPDIKYFSPAVSKRYTGKEDYFIKASKAIEFMVNKKPFTLGTDGMLKSGVIVRHLVLPLGVADSKNILDWYSNIKEKAYINLMSQYTPFGKIDSFPELQRKVTKREYDSVIDYALTLDIRNMFYQALESANEKYIPTWDY
jgi:hypothetical protein